MSQVKLVFKSSNQSIIITVTAVIDLVESKQIIHWKSVNHWLTTLNECLHARWVAHHCKCHHCKCHSSVSELNYCQSIIDNIKQMISFTQVGVHTTAKNTDVQAKHDGTSVHTVAHQFKQLNIRAHKAAHQFTHSWHGWTSEHTQAAVCAGRNIRAQSGTWLNWLIGVWKWISPLDPWTKHPLNKIQQMNKKQCSDMVWYMVESWQLLQQWAVTIHLTHESLLFNIIWGCECHTFKSNCGQPARAMMIWPQNVCSCACDHK